MLIAFSLSPAAFCGRHLPSHQGLTPCSTLVDLLCILYCFLFVVLFTIIMCTLIISVLMVGSKQQQQHRYEPNGG